MSDDWPDPIESLEDVEPADPQRSGDRRYDELATLHVGTGGEVWRVRDRREDLVLAMKVARSPTDDPRVEHEAAVLKRLAHPNIVALFESGRKVDGRAFCTMECVDGRTLEHELRRCPSGSDRLELLPYLRDACRAASHAHRARVLHGDLKPSNVMIDRRGLRALPGRGRGVVIGWGAARDLRGYPAGPYGVAVPEDRQDPRTDVLALGAMVYEVATGQPPFLGGPKAMAWMAHCQPPPRASGLPDVDPRLAIIADRALELRSGERYASADALADDLDAWFTEPEARPTEPSPWRWMVGLGAMGLMGGSAASVAVGVVAVAFAAVVIFGGHPIEHKEVRPLVEPPAQSGSALPDPVIVSPVPVPHPHPPPPPPPPSGTVIVSGNARLVTLTSGASSFGPGLVPPGAYAILAAFDDEALAEAGLVDVSSGVTVRIECTSSTRRCGPPEAPKAQLSVRLADGSWAFVWIDGVQLTHPAPLSAVPIDPGLHHVRIENPVTGLSYTTDVTATAGDSLVVRVPQEAR